VSFAAITLYVASQRVFIVISVYFVFDSVRKLLDTHLILTVLDFFLHSRLYITSSVETVSVSNIRKS
jgi:hypothetical protein